MSKRRNFKVHLPNWITRLFPEAIWKIPTGEKVLYLTFDDGPVPDVTPKILNILKENNIKATFFSVGENVEKYPDIFQRIKKEGHSIGNHTHNHIQGIKCSAKTYWENIGRADTVINSNMFRPPHGIIKRAQYRLIIQKYKLVMWDVISCDYDPKLSPEKCFNNVVDFVSDGSIITFHDSDKAKHNVLNTLPKVIEHLSQQGYTFKKIEFPRIVPLSKPNQSKNIRNSINKFLKGA